MVVKNYRITIYMCQLSYSVSCVVCVVSCVACRVCPCSYGIESRKGASAARPPSFCAACPADMSEMQSRNYTWVF